MRGRVVFWGLIGLALLIGAQAALDAYGRVGQPFAGVMVMENLLVAAGGGERGGLRPFDLVRVMNGQVLASGPDIQAEIARHPPGTTFHYIVARHGRLIEVDIASQRAKGHGFWRFVLEGLVGGLAVLALGALVFYLRPGTEQSWVFLAFCLVWFVIDVTYLDAHTRYRFGPLFLTAWAFSPAVFVHLALTFPQRRSVARRLPWSMWLPYVGSAGLAGLFQMRLEPGRVGAFAGVGAAYWGLALILLILSLARTSVRGSTPVVRQRARVLGAGFAVGFLPPVLGTAVEAIFRVPVPYLDQIWKLNLLFPAAVAYAMVRYDLFDLRTAIRVGTIYSAVTGLVVVAYTGAIAGLDLVSSRLELAYSPLIPAGVVALVVVLFLNPVYVRIQKLVDRVFFRQRYDIQRSLEHVSEAMISILDLNRIVQLMTQTVEDLLHPVRQTLLLRDEERRGYMPAEDGVRGVSPRLAMSAPALACLSELRSPVTREQLEEDPEFRPIRERCLRELDAVGAELVVPVIFRDRVTGLLVLGPKRSGRAYSTYDIRLLRLLANQSAVALEHAKAYFQLEAANAELTAALRRVELLESIRANLAKFVPRTVARLIEQAPEAPELDKREADVSVLFVDIVGYTRLSARLDPEQVNQLVERYFGSYLDEILKRGGDVNETAGDGLMVIFQDPDPRRHARAAVLTALGILKRTREINAELAEMSEPIALRIGVNSGLATVGATKIEGVTGTRWTYTASGQVTNLAARLAGVGEGDALIVGPATRARLDGEFTFEELGEQELKNVEPAVRVSRLTVGPAQRSASGS